MGGREQRQGLADDGGDEEDGDGGSRLGVKVRKLSLTDTLVANALLSLTGMKGLKKVTFSAKLEMMVV